MQRQRRRFVALVCLLAVAGMIHSVSGDGFRNPPEGADALSRAGSRLTHGTDASVVSHNPANLLDLEGPSVMATVMSGIAEKKYRTPMGQTEEMDAVSMMPAIYASIPVTAGKHVIGIGVSTPFGQGNEWEEKGVFTGMTPYLSELKSVNVSPVMAVALGESLHVGVGVNVLWASLKLQQTNPWSGIAGDTVGPSSRITLEGDGTGIGGKIGVTWLLTEKQRIAVMYHSPISVDAEGSFEADPLPPGLPPVVTASSAFATELEFPQIVALGYGIQLLDELRVEANVEWVEHSRYDQTVIDAGLNNLLLQGGASTDPIVAPQNWEDTWTFSIGADWQVAEHWALRGGYIYLPSPVPDATLAPTSAEADSHIITLGVGFENERHAVDLALAPAINDDRTDAFGGTYEINSGVVAASYSYAF